MARVELMLVLIVLAAAHAHAEFYPWRALTPAFGADILAPTTGTAWVVTTAPRTAAYGGGPRELLGRR
ncbi:MAG: hypothetical protein ABI131_08505 [Nostocoides sp.]